MRITSDQIMEKEVVKMCNKEGLWQSERRE